jgi:O-antigen/teichoic acid export membrane protein
MVQYSSPNRSVAGPTRQSQSPRATTAGRSWFWAITDQGIVSLAGFIATVIIGRYCAPEQLGIYSVVISGVWLLGGLLNALIWIPYTSRAPQLSGKRLARYAGSALLHLTVLLAFCTGGLVLTAGVAEIFGRFSIIDVGVANTICTFGLTLVPVLILLMLRTHLRRTAMAHLEMWRLWKIDIPISALHIILLLLFARLGVLTASSGILAMAIACGLSLGWLVLLWDEFRFDWRSARHYLFYNWRFGSWLVGATLAWLLAQNAYRWLVWSLEGLSALGEFSAAFYITMSVSPLLLAIENVTRALAANRLAGGQEGELRRATIELTLILALVFGALLTALGFFGGELVTTIYGEDYVGQHTVVATLCLGTFFFAMNIPVDSALLALRRGQVVLAASVTQLVLGVGIAAPLMLWLGTVAIGYAMAVSGVGGLIVRWHFFWRDQRNLSR